MKKKNEELDKKLFVWFLTILVLLASMLMMWLITLVADKFGDNVVVYWGLIILGLAVIVPFADVMRGKKTFMEWLKQESFGVGLILIIWFTWLNLILLKVMLEWKPEAIWAGPLTFIVLLIGAMFWIGFSWNNAKEDINEEETEEEDDS